MNMRSIWTEKCKMPSFPSLEGDAKTEVLVVGGGLAGILCAYYLQKAGTDCILVEANRICGGTTANTTAKITAQHGLIYHKLVKKYGTQIAQLYLRANLDAMREYRQLCSGISCDLESADSFIYSLSSPAAVQEEMTALEKIGYQAEYHEDLSLPIETKGAVCFPDQLQFHPLRFCGAISSGLPIYEQTKVIAYDGTGYITNRGKIRAEKAVIATHFPIFNKHGLFPLKMYQARSYFMAFRDFSIPDGMYVSAEASGFSFRKYSGITLLGTTASRTGTNKDGWDPLRQFAASHAPNAKEITRWATQDCITLDGIPYIGQYSPATPNLFVATGFNKWGMSSSMAAALLLRDLIAGKDNPYKALFDPSRSIWHPELVTNLLHSTLNLLKPTRPRCPHLGCALKWNRQEHSWDCPCHGSRFSEDGKLLNNPSNEDMT